VRSRYEDGAIGGLREAILDRGCLTEQALRLRIERWYLRLGQWTAIKRMADMVRERPDGRIEEVRAGVRGTFGVVPTETAAGDPQACRLRAARAARSRSAAAAHNATR